MNVDINDISFIDKKLVSEQVKIDIKGKENRHQSHCENRCGQESSHSVLKGTNKVQTTLTAWKRMSRMRLVALLSRLYIICYGGAKLPLYTLVLVYKETKQTLRTVR